MPALTDADKSRCRWHLELQEWNLRVSRFHLSKNSQYLLPLLLREKGLSFKPPERIFILFTEVTALTSRHNITKCVRSTICNCNKMISRQVLGLLTVCTAVIELLKAALQLLFGYDNKVIVFLFGPTPAVFNATQSFKLFSIFLGVASLVIDHVVSVVFVPPRKRLPYFFSVLLSISFVFEANLFRVLKFVFPEVLTSFFPVSQVVVTIAFFDAINVFGPVFLLVLPDFVSVFSSVISIGLGSVLFVCLIPFFRLRRSCFFMLLSILLDVSDLTRNALLKLYVPQAMSSRLPVVTVLAKLSKKELLGIKTRYNIHVPTITRCHAQSVSSTAEHYLYCISKQLELSPGRGFETCPH
jgi:hypothetical protein